jgi:hypothetical protein
MKERFIVKFDLKIDFNVASKVFESLSALSVALPGESLAPQAKRVLKCKKLRN